LTVPYDPFLGSGTSLIAAEMTVRRFFRQVATHPSDARPSGQAARSAHQEAIALAARAALKMGKSRPLRAQRFAPLSNSRSTRDCRRFDLRQQ
jgi:hypothetical protein